MPTTTQTPRIKGVLTPVVTPFDSALRPDAKRLIRQCRWLLTRTSGSRYSAPTPKRTRSRCRRSARCSTPMIDAGLPPARMMPGTGCSALTESVELTRHAVSLGCGGVLMLPPFYYKGVSDEGLYRNFSEIIQRVGDSRLRIYLYHIPPVSQVAITLPLIERLLKAYPGTIAGTKDSSGVWETPRRCSSGSSRRASTCSPAPRPSCFRHCGWAVRVASAPPRT